MGEIQT